jgi:quinol monooxygenase YgiN
MLRRALLFVLPLALLAILPAVRADDENPIVTLVKSKVKDKDKPFGMTVAFKVKAGDEKAFEEAFTACVAGTRKEPGCLAYFLNRDVDDPSTFVVFERFKKISALEDHAKSAYVAELLKKIGPLLDGAPGVKVYGVASE